MTHDQFIAACVAREIDPIIALENENVVDALSSRNDILVVEVLDEEF